jgi:hypothetical protein
MTTVIELQMQIHFTHLKKLTRSNLWCHLSIYYWPFFAHNAQSSDECTQHAVKWRVHTTHSQVTSAHNAQSSDESTQDAVKWRAHTRRSQVTSAHNTQSSDERTQDAVKWRVHTTHSQVTSAHNTQSSDERTQRTIKWRLLCSTRWLSRLEPPPPPITVTSHDTACMECYSVINVTPDSHVLLLSPVVIHKNVSNSRRDCTAVSVMLGTT